MKLRNEHIRSYIDDIRMIGLLRFLTWQGSDVAFSWIGPYEPATNSDDEELNRLMHGNRTHYLYYRALVEKYLEENSSVLDVGCGSGQRTAMLARYAKRVVAIDSDIPKISCGAIMNSAPDTSWAIGNFETWEHPETYDAVFAVEIIEHVDISNQESFIDKLVGKVSPGGVLLMTTPRDRPPDRKPPHVGLWDDGIAESFASRFSAQMEYFSRDVLVGDNRNPWCEKDESTHYVFTVHKDS